jgi:hypothetical protein
MDYVDANKPISIINLLYLRLTNQSQQTILISIWSIDIIIYHGLEQLINPFTGI